MNGSVDKMGGVLTDQLSVQKSIDDNIRMLVKILQNGGLAQTQQSKEEALVDNYKDQPTSDFRTSSSVQAPISVKRNNVYKIKEWRKLFLHSFFYDYFTR